MKKNNYFYIDETGHVNNDSPLFVFGCIKTDTPNLLKQTLESLKKELSEDVLLNLYGDKVMKNNFHATGDHPDVRTAMYRLLPHLNFRAYFTVLLKNTEYYRNLKIIKDDYEIIESMLRKVIVPRLIKNREDTNSFFFETLEVEKKSLNKILEELFKSCSKKIETNYDIVGKENPNMPIIDYINFIINKVLTKGENEKVDDWVVRAFDSFKDKIGLIHFQNDDTYYSRQGKESFQISMDNLRKKLVVD
tara:strand:- start:58809 stop:59552 length:744 start_codon:yes stop_codon:yes gene_type:complete